MADVTMKPRGLTAASVWTGCLGVGWGVCVSRLFNCRLCEKGMHVTAIAGWVHVLRNRHEWGCVEVFCFLFIYFIHVFIFCFCLVFSSTELISEGFCPWAVLAHIGK